MFIFYASGIQTSQKKIVAPLELLMVIRISEAFISIYSINLWNI